MTSTLLAHAKHMPRTVLQYTKRTAACSTHSHVGKLHTRACRHAYNDKFKNHAFSTCKLILQKASIQTMTGKQTMATIEHRELNQMKLVHHPSHIYVYWGNSSRMFWHTLILQEAVPIKNTRLIDKTQTCRLLFFSVL